jgi:hypothetical protein
MDIEEFITHADVMFATEEGSYDKALFSADDFIELLDQIQDGVSEEITFYSLQVGIYDIADLETEPSFLVHQGFDIEEIRELIRAWHPRRSYVFVRPNRVMVTQATTCAYPPGPASRVEGTNLCISNPESRYGEHSQWEHMTSENHEFVFLEHIEDAAEAMEYVEEFVRSRNQAGDMGQTPTPLEQETIIEKFTAGNVPPRVSDFLRGELSAMDVLAPFQPINVVEELVLLEYQRRCNHGKSMGTVARQLQLLNELSVPPGSGYLIRRDRLELPTLPAHLSDRARPLLVARLRGKQHHDPNLEADVLCNLSYKGHLEKQLAHYVVLREAKIPVELYTPLRW